MVWCEYEVIRGCRCVSFCPRPLLSPVWSTRSCTPLSQNSITLKKASPKCLKTCPKNPLWITLPLYWGPTWSCRWCSWQFAIFISWRWARFLILFAAIFLSWRRRWAAEHHQRSQPTTLFCYKFISIPVCCSSRRCCWWRWDPNFDWQSLCMFPLSWWLSNQLAIWLWWAWWFLLTDWCRVLLPRHDPIHEWRNFLDFTRCFPEV